MAGCRWKVGGLFTVVLLTVRAVGPWTVFGRSVGSRRTVGGRSTHIANLLAEGPRFRPPESTGGRLVLFTRFGSLLVYQICCQLSHKVRGYSVIQRGRSACRTDSWSVGSRFGG